MHTRLRHALADLFIAASEQDAERIVRIAAELGSPGGRADLRAMERDVTLALREDFNHTIGHIQLGRAMLKLLFIFGQNGINITRDYCAELVDGFKVLVGEMRKSSKSDALVPLPDGMLFINRLQFGFYSVLARLDVEVDYLAVEAPLLAEALAR